MDTTTWTLQLGHVIGPDAVRLIGDELGNGAGRMGCLAASFSTLAVCSKQSVHRRLRGEIGALVEQDCPGLSGSGVNEAAVQGLEHRLALFLRERIRRCRPRCSRAESWSGTVSVVRRPRTAECRTSGTRANERLEHAIGVVHDRVC